MEPRTSGLKALESAINFFDTEKIIPDPTESLTSSLKALERAIDLFQHGKKYFGANRASCKRFEVSGRCN